MKTKFFPDHENAAKKLWDDVGSNKVRWFDVPNYQSGIQIPVHPPSLANKWTHVVVAVSGEPATGRDWMVVVPYRLDKAANGNKKCFDLDPVLFVLENSTGSAHPSGAVAYHQDFPGRTSPAPTGVNHMSFSQSVGTLRQNVVTTTPMELHTAPSEVLNALQHMVEAFKSDFMSEGNP